MKTDTITLPLQLRARKEALEAEMKKVELGLLEEELVPSINEYLEKEGVEGVFAIGWEMNPESDDEGGTSWYVGGIYLMDENEDVIELEGEGEDYEQNIMDGLYDCFNEYSDILNGYDIEELQLKGGQQA